MSETNEASVQSVVRLSRQPLDPRQPIYDAMNYLGAVVPGRKPDDTTLIIDAYEKAYQIEDAKTQKLFLGLIKELRSRNECIGRISKAWENAASRLRDACQMVSKELG